MITCGDYTCSKSLGKGGDSRVMLAEHNETGQSVALKIVKTGDSHDQDVVEFVKNEARLLKASSHDNVIKIVEFQSHAFFTGRNDKSHNVAYIALEHAENGDLYRLLTSIGKFSERLARYYFIQLLTALEHLHSIGVSHLDVKPENILFDADFNMKLCDFGFSSDRKIHSTKKGTLSYVAPEVLTQEKYCAPITDIYSAAVILFTMVSGHPPYCRPDASDMRYKPIMNNNMERFWEITCKKKPNGSKFYSEGFKSLMNLMLTPDPLLRPSISELKMHDWCIMDVPTHEEVLAHFDEIKRMTL